MEDSQFGLRRCATDVRRAVLHLRLWFRGLDLGELEHQVRRRVLAVGGEEGADLDREAVFLEEIAGALGPLLVESRLHLHDVVAAAARLWHLLLTDVASLIEQNLEPWRGRLPPAARTVQRRERVHGATRQPCAARAVSECMEPQGSRVRLEQHSLGSVGLHEALAARAAACGAPEVEAHAAAVFAQIELVRTDDGAALSAEGGSVAHA